MSRALNLHLALNRLPNLDPHPTLHLMRERHGMPRPSIEDRCTIVTNSDSCVDTNGRAGGIWASAIAHCAPKNVLERMAKKLARLVA